MARTEVTGRQLKDKSVSLADDVVDTLPVANGGTGVDALASGSVLLGAGAGAVQVVYPGASGNLLTSNGSTWVSAAPPSGAGTGDVTSTATSSVDSEVALYSGTTGKQVKRATGTGLASLSSGVLSTVAAPAGTVVGTTDTQTLTGKTISGADNTLTAIQQSSVVNLTTDLAGKASSVHTHAITDVTNLSTTLDGKQSTSEKGTANGYASLDQNGKIPVGQLPASLMQYLGVWDASTNSPSLADGTGDTGDVYRVTVGGARNLGSGSISFAVGDYVIYNGAVWEKSDTTDAVSTVAGRTGDVTLTKSDVGLSNVDDTSDALKNSAVATLENKTLSNPTVTNYTESVVALGTVGSSATLSISSGTVITATLTASTATTFTMPTAVNGKSFVLFLSQAATTGNGTATFTGVKWGASGAPTVTATAGKLDIFSFFCVNSSWFGNVAKGYTA